MRLARKVWEYDRFFFFPVKKWYTTKDNLPPMFHFRVGVRSTRRLFNRIVTQTRSELRRKYTDPLFYGKVCMYLGSTHRSWSDPVGVFHCRMTLARTFYTLLRTILGSVVLPRKIEFARISCMRRTCTYLQL